MRLDQAIAEYEIFRTSQQYARNTVRIERQALDLLLSEVGNIQVKHLDARHGEAFVSAMLSKGLKPGTVNLYRGAFRRFCSWCHTRRFLPGSNNPLGTTRNLADHKAPRRRIPAHDFPRLLDAAEHPQERIIVALGLYLFLRASEVACLDIEHVHLDRSEILVFQPKTGRYDEMPIAFELEVELRRWLTWYAEDQAPVRGALMPHWPLVPARRRSQLWNDGSGKNGGRPIVPRFGHMNPMSRAKQIHGKVQKTLRTFGWEVGAEDREGVHTLRRSGARALFDEMVETGVRDGVLRIVQSMLHHKSVTMTEHYLGLEADREKRNDQFKGRRMFRPMGDNVVELRHDAVV